MSEDRAQIPCAHTPEPWVARMTGVPEHKNVTWLIETMDGAFLVAECHFAAVDNEANAKRIAACVNALTGQRVALVSDTTQRIRELVEAAEESLQCTDYAEALRIAARLRAAIVAMREVSAND